MHLGILVSHPIQYYAPWFRDLSQVMHINVFYAHRQDAQGQAEAGFGVEFEWDIPLLKGYSYRFLNNVARKPGVDTFFGCNTPEIYHMVEKQTFDAFLIFGWNHLSSWQAIFACRRHGIPVLMRGDSQLNTPRSFVKKIIKYLPYRLLLPRLDAHLYVGKKNKEYLQHYGVPQDRLFFAPHFVDNEFFDRSAQLTRQQGKHRAIRRQFNIPEDAFVVSFVGKFIPIKRPVDFIEMCVYLFKKNSEVSNNIHAILIGDGPLRHLMETIACPYNDRIHFVGFRNQSELPIFYCASDVLILPGRETWGLVVNEAMACGLPAIVSDVVGCAPDLIDPGKTGYIYKMGNIEELANCIIKIKKELSRNPEVIKQAISEKINRYSIKEATSGLEKALNRILENKKTALKTTANSLNRDE